MADIGIKLTAQDNTKAAFDSVGRNLANIQTSAASVAGALAGIGIGISVGGFVAMTRAIVDGLDAMNDLKDATGASIENISALEDVARRSGASFDTVSTALVKLNQGLNAAKPGSETENAIKAIGLSVKDLKALDPAEAFQKVAVALSGFADDANKARLTQELFGKSLKEVAPLLKDLAESGQLNSTVTTAQAEAAEKLNKQIFSLQKNALDLGRALTSTLIPALADGVERFILAQKHAGSLLDTLALYGRLDYSKNIQGNLGDVEKQIAGLEERATRITSTGAMRGNDKMIADLKAQAAYLKELRQAKILAEQGDNSDAVSRRFTRDRPSINAPDLSAAKDASAAAAKALADQNREIAAQNKLIAENAGLTGSFTEDWNRLTAIYTKGGFSLEQYTEAQAKLLANQPAIKANVEAEAKANALGEKASAEALESRQKYVASLGEGLDKLQQETATQQEYIDRLGLSKEAVAELDAAKLESQATIQDLIVLKKIEQGLDEEQYEIYVKTAAELRKQASLKIQGSIKESQLEIEKEIAAERKRGWEETDRIARDVFTNWATDGGNAAQKIGDTLKKALLSAIYDATLKPLVMKVYTSIAGGTSGTAGSGSAAGLPGSGGGFGSGFTGNGFKGFATSGVESLGEMFINSGSETLNTVGSSLLNNSSEIAGFANIAGEALGYLNAIDLWTKGQRGAAAGSAIGTYFGGPVGAAIGQAIGSTLDYKLTPKGGGITATIGGASGLPSGAVGAYTLTEQSGPLSGTTMNGDWSTAPQGVADYISQNVKAITAANRAYGESLGLTSDSITNFTKSFDINTTGMDAAAQQAAINKELEKFAAEQAGSAFGAATTAFAKSGETAAVTLQRLGGDLTTVNSAFTALGSKLLDVSVAGGAAASGIVDALGGREAFAQKTAEYYANFYSDPERRANTVKQINAATAGTGLDAATGSREDFRRIVDAQDLTTEAGRKTYAALLSVAGAFASITPVAADAAKATQDMADAAKSAANSAYAALTASIDVERRRISITRDLAQESVNSLSEVFDLLKSNVEDLYGTVASTAAQQAAQGSAFIDQALSTAKATGYLPDSQALGDAVGGARGGVNAAIYASQQDADFARLELAGRLDQLKVISGDQLSDAKKALNIAQGQLDALTLLSESAKAQLDAALGLNTMVRSLGEAMGYFEKAVGELGKGGTGKAADPGVVSFGGGSAPGAGSVDPKYAQIYDVQGIIGRNYITDAAQISELDRLNALVNQIGVATPEDVQKLAEAAMASGASIQDVANATGYLARDWEAVFARAGVPSFAVGTNFVPQDMLAQIHKGEAIVPAAYNPAAGGGGGNSRLEALVEALTAEVGQLRAQVAVTNELTSRTANAVEGNQSRPLLVEIAA